MAQLKKVFKVNKIGIALAAFKPEIQAFSEQLKSIQVQTFWNWVCIIVFDSPSQDILNDLTIKPFRDDPRFHWHENNGQLGHKKNFERAIHLALKEGVDAIGCSDQDDIWYPEKLQKSVEFLEKMGPLSLVHSDMHILKNGVILKETAWQIENRGISNVKPKHLLIRNVVAGCSMLMDATLVRRYPRIPDGVEFHDHWYALMASANGGVYSLNEVLFAYRQHDINVVGVTPFQGICKLPKGIKIREIFEKCKKGWSKTEKLTRDYLQLRLHLSFTDKLSLTSSFDLGLGLLLMGIFYVIRDKPLARACFARSFGKFLSLFSMH